MRKLSRMLSAGVMSSRLFADSCEFTLNMCLPITYFSSISPGIVMYFGSSPVSSISPISNSLGTLYYPWLDCFSQLDALSSDWVLDSVLNVLFDDT